MAGRLLTVNSCSGCSDLRLKKNVQPLSGALDQLLQLRGVTYEWTDPSLHNGDSGTVRGFIAQDVEKIFPSWVDDKGYKAKDGTYYRTLEMRQIEALEVEGIRELKVKNDGLAAEVSLLRDQMKELAEGRQPRISGFNLNGVGFGVGGLAIGLGLVVSRRKRSEGGAATKGAES